LHSKKELISDDTVLVPLLSTFGNVYGYIEMNLKVFQDPSRQAK
jgi:hypothetical protein